MNTDTQLEISERAAFWQLKFEEVLQVQRGVGFSESTARLRAAEQADICANQRFPSDYK